MKIYELTNKRIGSETIQMLETKLSSLIDNPSYINTAKLTVLKNSVQIIKDYQPYNSNIHLSSALKHKRIAYDVAIFCVLGLNPDAAIEIRKQYHSKQTRSSNNILMHMLDVNPLHKLVDDFSKCEGNPKKAIETSSAITTLLNKSVITILDESSESIEKKRKFSTEKKQELINDLAKKEMQKDITLNKSQIAKILEKKPGIRIGAEQIRRAYLSKYPNFE